jgi:dehydrogenase/reductase SDR family protein 12
MLSGRGATVYMVCRDSSKAEAVAAELRALDNIGGIARGNLVPVQGDVALAADVARVAREVDAAAGGRGVDGLVCNAGALLAARTVTTEGLETTAAAHLVHGTYLLTILLKPTLQRAAEPRVVIVSSGGMLTTKWPGMGVATSETKPSAYDGQLAYAFAKRGQVLLAERWAAWADEARGPVVVSCHPGWVDTPGVAAAYGATARLLAPMRTLHQGAEGIAWLAAAPKASLVPGAFYLDRTPQRKHVEGGWVLNRRGDFTRNSAAEVDELIAGLAKRVAPYTAYCTK